jgi:hypothetical protein
VDLADFHYFFDCCVGQWTTERTYHYLTHQEVERSRTEFRVDVIPLDLKQKVLTDNHYENVENLEQMPGFRLYFHTISEKGEELSQELRALFIPKQRQGSILHGDYLRDQAYEEARPIISTFHYDETHQELLMTTDYTSVVSVDSITMVNPETRIRRILNYKRPNHDQPMDTLVLAGFGIEQKVS